MYTAITRSYRRLICTFILLILNIATYAQLVEPTCNEPIDPEIQFQKDKENKQLTSVSSSDGTKFFKLAQVIVSPDKVLNGTFEYSTNLVLYITNKISNLTYIKPVDLASIEEIEIKQWSPVEQSEGFYKFVPSLYYLYTKNEIHKYYANIPIFNVFKLRIYNNQETLYTIFYDFWVEGKKGFFHWENSKAYQFNYNFTHPLNGVAIRIKFGLIEEE